jgi:hypothetical protein
VIAREPSQEQWQCSREVGECPYRYKPSSAYYARIKRNGKEIRQSLKTHGRALPKRRLADKQQEVLGLRQQVQDVRPSHVLKWLGTVRPRFAESYPITISARAGIYKERRRVPCS